MEVASGVEEDELEGLTPVLGSLPSTLETQQSVEVKGINNLVHKKCLSHVKADYEILSFCFSPILILELLASAEIRR